MIYLLYDLLLCLSALVLVPYYLLRGVRYGKTRRGIRERLGSYHQGFISGLLSAHTGRKFSVKEVDCWCSGDRVCRFDVKAAS